MGSYKHSFIEFMVRSKVLTFGDFVTKSGRNTPFFINTGRYRTGAQIAELAGYYADAILESGIEFTVLFGPAYKGIPLAVATALILSQRGRDVPFCFNRKEVKDHGEGGNLVGHTPALGERILVIEDVTTAGTSVRETVPPLLSSGASVAGLIVSVDRMERGTGAMNALTQLREEFQMRTIAIVTIEEVMEYLHNRAIDGQVVLDDATLARLRDYRSKFGGTH